MPSGLKYPFVFVAGFISDHMSRKCCLKVEARPVPTVRVTVVATGASVPEVPVMVIVEVPSAAVAATVNVSRLVAVAGLVPIATVTPVGRADVASVTLPVNPFSSVTVMVLDPELPGATVRAAGEAARV
jgi:hypothetical protein